MFHATHIYTVLSDRLSKYLYDERLTQAEFAKKANVGVATVYRCLSPFYVPSTTVYRKIAKAMDVDPYTLAEHEPKEKETYKEYLKGKQDGEDEYSKNFQQFMGKYAGQEEKPKAPKDFDDFIEAVPALEMWLRVQEKRIFWQRVRFGAIWFFIGVASLAWILFAYVAFTSNL